MIVRTNAHSPPVIAIILGTLSRGPTAREVRALSASFAGFELLTHGPGMDRPPTFRVIFGLGANIGDPLGQLREAVRSLRSTLDGRAKVSSLYRSAPVGPSQPDFLNAAVLVATSRTPLELLDLAQGIENALGRVREVHHGPRTLDIDLLWADFTAQHPRLQVPHPELQRRAFAWLPTVELVPELATDSLSFHGQRIEKMEAPGWESSDPPRKFPS